MSFDASCMPVLTRPRILTICFEALPIRLLTFFGVAESDCPDFFPPPRPPGESPAAPQPPAAAPGASPASVAIAPSPASASPASAAVSIAVGVVGACSCTCSERRALEYLKSREFGS